MSEKMPIARYTTKELIAMCNTLEHERKLLTEIQRKERMCDLTGHKNVIALQIQDMGMIELTCCGGNDYSQKLIRGREMIMLGVKKALSAKADEQYKKIRALEEMLNNARVMP